MARRALFVCFIAYSGVVAWVTLRSLPGLDGSPDLVPFLDTWRQLRDYGDRATLWEVGGNFVLFVPFGFLLAGALRRSALTIATIACLVSTIIEFTQWQSSRRHPTSTTSSTTLQDVCGATVSFSAVRSPTGRDGDRHTRRVTRVPIALAIPLPPVLHTRHTEPSGSPADKSSLLRTGRRSIGVPALRTDFQTDRPPTTSPRRPVRIPNGVRTLSARPGSEPERVIRAEALPLGNAADHPIIAAVGSSEDRGRCLLLRRVRWPTIWTAPADHRQEST